MKMLSPTLSFSFFSMHRPLEERKKRKMILLRSLLSTHVPVLLLNGADVWISSIDNCENKKNRKLLILVYFLIKNLCGILICIIRNEYPVRNVVPDTIGLIDKQSHAPLSLSLSIFLDQHPFDSCCYLFEHRKIHQLIIDQRSMALATDQREAPCRFNFFDYYLSFFSSLCDVMQSSTRISKSVSCDKSTVSRRRERWSN